MKERTKLLIILAAIAIGLPIGFFGAKRFGQTTMLFIGAGMIGGGAILSVYQTGSNRSYKFTDSSNFLAKK